MRTYFDLTGRSALVTGAGAGIGAAVSEALAAAGAAVLVTDISGDAAAVVAERINTAAGGGKSNTAAGGGKADSAALDVNDRDAAVAAAAQAAALGEGNLHIVVNNAGVTSPAMFPKLTDETFRLTFDVHVMGTFHVTQAALPHLPTDGTGRVINVTSSAGITGTLGQVNYSAAKAAIIGFTKSLARELAPKNIMVNALAPLAATPMTETIRTNEKFAANMMNRIPLKRWAQAEEVAGAFVFLASDAASYITGQVLPVDGGMVM
ncbi:3-oxoacyl-ACP reductase [Mycolicibacterium mageritense DSM 44476 = CIP 104973]|uniref:3-oxoacyl-[acyl-carrier-protein] reductase MabA n=1 Tax=Mycolicibacterium mageritense TaxID=53462 RepID=A0ABM7HK15_MYCME|nr:SDR family NAD(P)-dependent oxidoreductase [Mycolicibacterium mageritense]MCC9182345.1 SDR family oxidoreductase [Mycolicibacterium mageritense]BBX30820.1 3-oxoacyl-ACP reductase [Mycolicibacterium mageritense]CDO23989.1 3-oxoacyl-ACP reductase [Mycolicibacterium mageritense DSM 44476 = CIP 104973]